ncbi:MAG: hypothetical protein V4627_13580 [Pseudomonadota bacterium]
MNPIFVRLLRESCLLMGVGLLASHVQAQLPTGGQSQLRPPGGAHIAPQGIVAVPAKTQPLSEQSNVRKVHKPVQVDLPSADFGKTYIQREVQLQVSLRKLYEVVDNAGKTGELPEVRISGAQAAAFGIAAPKCVLKLETIAVGIASVPMYTYTCSATATFRPTTEGLHTALLVASFSDGDRFTSTLTGVGQPTSIAMPPPVGAKGLGLQPATLGHQPPSRDTLVPETLDFGTLVQGGRKTLRVVTQYPAGSKVLPHLAGAEIKPSGFGFSLGEAAGGAMPGEKASFTITYAPLVCCGQGAASFAFKDADGRNRNLILRGSVTSK